ncbi:rust resistance kinase Lr10-like [Zingiber officinale]|nr:rust resistance kinase Lr10-like [Zingiber officinale]
MACKASWRSFYALLLPLLFLLLSQAAVTATGQQQQQWSQEACAPFSCGLFHDISHPFRRTTDPPQCGDRMYELTCDSDKATISIGSTHYLITQLSYKRGTIRLVDPKFASGSCGLPSQSLTPSDDYSSFGVFSPAGNVWASFMNCTRRIEGLASYRPVPCLSNNNTFVYVVVADGGNRLSYLYPSCHFLSMIPAIDAESSTRDAFRILHMGFDLLFYEASNDWKRIIRQCAIESKSLFFDLLRGKHMLSQVYFLPYSEIHFAFCIGDHYQRAFITQITIAVVVFIQIVQLLAVFLILGRLVIAPMIVWFLLGYKLWNRGVTVDLIEKFLRRQQTLMPTRYAYSELIAITRHFREKLGQGGFGSVFKGELLGDRFVAVKMLSNSKCNGDDFINEVSTLGRIHHVNVVRLVGYCSDGSKRALIYEYMPNGSLDKYIFAPNGTNGHFFTSEKLIQIAIGIARGIDYLHQGCDMQILHFDIKPHNILIDHNFTPKISDFGLAKLYPKTNALVSISAARGTIGYIAPELISRSFGKISFKSDVYSFGMLLMEMAGRRRNVDPHAGNSSQVYYPSWIYDKLTQPDEVEVVNKFEIQDLEKKLAIVGLWCIQLRPSDRPTMSRVIEMLEVDDVDCLPIPPKPFLSSRNSSTDRSSILTKHSFDSISIELSSVVSE